MLEKKALHNFLKNNGLDAMLLSSESNIRYFTSYTGFSPLERDAFALISTKNIYLFTSPLYSAGVRKEIKNIEVIEHTGEMPFLKNLEAIINKERLENVGFENDSVTVKEYLQLTSQITSRFIAKDFSLLRSKKTSDEIKLIQAACRIGDKAHNHIQHLLQPGITEIGLAWEMEKYIREQGGELAFPTIVAFSKNSAVPHHKASDLKLKSNDIALLDFGVKVNGYCSDMSRTLFVGKPTKKQASAYLAAKQAQQKAVDYLNSELGLKSKDGIKAAEVDKEARDYIIAQGYPSIPHSLGHGIGIAVHEAPRISPNSKDVLEEGMVFSIEPGIYLDEKFGIRIEDLYTIQNSKLIQLTRSAII